MQRSVSKQTQSTSVRSNVTSDLASNANTISSSCRDVLIYYLRSLGTEIERENESLFRQVVVYVFENGSSIALEDARYLIE